MEGDEVGGMGVNEMRKDLKGQCSLLGKRSKRGVHHEQNIL